MSISFLLLPLFPLLGDLFLSSKLYKKTLNTKQLHSKISLLFTTFILVMKSLTITGSLVLPKILIFLIGLAGGVNICAIAFEIAMQVKS